MSNSNRVTIMIDEDLDRKVRTYQANHVKESVSTFSFSRAVNEIVENGLKKADKEFERYQGTYKRVTVMMGAQIDKAIKIKYGKHIIACANNYCEFGSWSYSREVNKLLRLGLGLKK